MLEVGNALKPLDSSQFEEELDRQIDQHTAPKVELELPEPLSMEESEGASDQNAQVLRQHSLTENQTESQNAPPLIPEMQKTWQSQLASRVSASQQLKDIRQAIQDIGTGTSNFEKQLTKSLDALSKEIDSIYPAAHTAISEIGTQSGPSDIPLQKMSERQLAIAEGLNRLSDALDKLSHAWETRAIEDKKRAVETAAHGHHHHHDGGGAIIVDLDEAVHGVYAAIGYLVQSFKGGSGGVAQQFKDNANLLASNPTGWITNSEAPQGAVDFGVSVGIAAVLLPLAVLAIKAGVEEMHGASHTGKELKRKIADMEADVEGLANSGLTSNVQMPRKLAELADAVNRERLTAMKFLVKQNKADGRIGLFSASAGSAILTKASAEIAEKAAYIATGANHAAILATEGVGFASTFGLGPVAALASTGLGGYALTKSIRKRDEFKSDKQLAERQIAALIGNDNEQVQNVSAYHTFLSAKLEQHDKFFDSYVKWNKGFLSGSTLYSAGTTAKMAVAIAAFAGASALSHGAIPAALLASVSVGGAIMGVSSQHFLTGHGRQQRYQNYYKDDDPELDRNFLASVDLLEDAGSLRGLKLRADFFRQISSRDDQRQSFLSNVAGATGKRFDDQYTYTADSPEVIERRGPKLTKKEVAQRAATRTANNSVGRLMAAGKFATQAVKSASISSATSSAKKEWNDSRAYLTRTSLKTWLNEPDNIDHQIKFMSKMLDTQIDFIEQKVDAKVDTYKIASNQLSSGVNPGAEAVNASTATSGTQQPRELKKLLVQLDKDLEKDQLLHAQALKLRTALQSLSNGSWNAAKESELASAMSQFIKVQSGETYDSNATANVDTARDQFANYMMKDAPKRYRDLRGKLIETELQSARLRDQVSTSATQSQ